MKIKATFGWFFFLGGYMHLGYSVSRGEQIMEEPESFNIKILSSCKGRFKESELYKTISADQVIDLPKDISGTFTLYSSRDIEYIYVHANELHTDLGIPFDMTYMSLTRPMNNVRVYSRYYSNGKPQYIKLREENLLLPIKQLHSLSKEPDLLIQKVVEANNKITPLDWSKQDIYGKLYLTNKLLTTQA